MKNNIEIFKPFSINPRSFASAFHALLTTLFSLDHFICLSYSTAYCFTSSHNKHAEPTFKDGQSEERRKHLIRPINFLNFVPAMVYGEEHFVVLEDPKRLLRQFLMHSLHFCC